MKAIMPHEPNEEPLSVDERAITPSLTQLSPWNPLDHLRLLWWTLMEPQQLKAHREQFGKQAELPTANWLVSTLLWLPFFLPFSAVGFGIIPVGPDSQIYFWASGGLFIPWFLTGVFGDRDEEAEEQGVVLAGGLGVVLWVGLALVLAVGLALVLAVGLALEMTVGLVGVLAVGLAVGLTLGLALGLGGVLAGVLAGVLMVILAVELTLMLTVEIAVGLAGVLAVGLVVGFSAELKNAVKESLKTSRASWKTRRAFGLLVAAHAFLVWFSFLGGWRVFE